MASSTDRFNVAVLSYEVMDENRDGIYEPGSTYTIYNLTLTNNGGLVLPAGCQIEFPDTVTSRWIDRQVHILPEIAVGGVIHVPSSERTFTFQIPTLNEPCHQKHFRATTLVATNVTCLDHVFLESIVDTQPIPVQFPIQIAAIQATTYLAPNEATSIVVRLNNISTKGYGTDAYGRVEARCRLHPLMEVLPCPNGTYAVRDGQAVREFHCVPPTSEVSFTVNIRMKAEAGMELFESLQWMVDVYLRGKCIEYHSGMIRVTPLFQPATLADVVLVTCPAIDRAEFLCWSYLLQLCGLSVNFWDLERYRTLSHDDFTWVGTCRHVIFPCHPDQNATLSAMSYADFILHFQSHKDASMFLFGVDQQALNGLMFDFSRPAVGTLKNKDMQQSRAEYVNLLPAHPVTQTMDDEVKTGLYKIYLPDPPPSSPVSSGDSDRSWRGIHCCPTDGDARSAAIDERESLIAKDGYRQYVAAAKIGLKKDSESCSPFSYVYGERGQYRCALPKTARLAANISLVGAGRLQDSELPFAWDGANFKALEKTFTREWGFTNALLTMMALMPVQDLFKHILDRTYLSTRKFQSHGTIVTFSEMVGIILAHRIEQEWSLPTDQAPITRSILADLAALNIHAPENSELTVDSSIATVKAFELKRAATFWSAFPWCCTETSRKRDRLAEAVRDFTGAAPVPLKERILSSANQALKSNETVRPLAYFTPMITWPACDFPSNQNILLGEPTQTRQCNEQLQGWAAIGVKQQVWTQRAQEAAMLAAQAHQQAEAQRLYALQMSAYMYQMALQQQQQQSQSQFVQPTGLDRFQQLGVLPVRLEYSSVSGYISQPEVADVGSPSGFVYSPGALLDDSNMPAQAPPVDQQQAQQPKQQQPWTASAEGVPAAGPAGETMDDPQPPMKPIDLPSPSASSSE